MRLDGFNSKVCGRGCEEHPPSVSRGVKELNKHIRQVIEKPLVAFLLLLASSRHGNLQDNALQPNNDAFDVWKWLTKKVTGVQA